ncbi:hypothetical protein RhiirA5_421182 [Rhizophagus irregularis]|uniref:Uncharacterized protein n=1 Tax=Rhizophagus irregularis TaxID=588596 RepID=A0A2I1ESM1_9GLOM|nr:hypothetical protein RhiirA5_421182 [Rhizophagus irregularis]PKC63177.1 hypothetical protein RhiirA1_464114 [Rhizophagus irregularis]PKY25065.1 hypothetical protein RhiirB3_439853 [Rhizophagus irregularis]GET62133.1 hypothetical protein RIR_jg12503.t1 [Rhizophagus irregularis DAOM 181602=DAOM 197198]CAB5324849.1 unnamed protein product [Rhizophagus irregularis]
MLEDIITPPKFSEYFFNELEENVLENIITSSKSPEHLFNELEEELTELFDSGNYEARKIINQNLHHSRNSNKNNCEWYCNFFLPKTENSQNKVYNISRYT